MKSMERILMDYYLKDNILTSIADNNSRAADTTAQIINNVYAWLYQAGILKKISFRYVEYSDMVFFAFDVKDLVPFIKQLQDANIDNVDIAIRLLFYTDLKRCRYSGAHQLLETMETYRDNCGCLGKSYENFMIQDMNNLAVGEIYKVKQDLGIRAAAEKAFDMTSWGPKNDISVLARELIDFIYDYDVFEFRDAFDSIEDGIAHMKENLSNSHSAKNMIQDFQEFLNSVDGNDFKQRLTDFISKIKEVFPANTVE